MSSKTNLMTFWGSQYNYFTAPPSIEHFEISPHIEHKSVFQEVLLPERHQYIFSLFLKTVCQMTLGA